MPQKSKPIEIEILDNEDRYCLYCGQPLKRGYDEYTPYHYCDCPDVLHNEKIRQEITKLKEQLKPTKFIVVKKAFLVLQKGVE